MSENKAVTTTQDPIYKMLAGYKSAIASVLPKHLTPEKFLRVAYQVVNRTPKLKKCSSLSLINSIIEASILGLEIGRTAHLIPFKTDAVLVVDYKGLIELAHHSEKVTSTPLKPVYENDLFDYEEGTQRFIKHKPAKENRGKLVAAYAIVNYKDGGYDFEVVLPEDIAVTKKRAPGAKKSDSPWNTEDEWTMWCKTAMRRLAKRIPQSPELQKAAYLDELVEAGLKQNISHITDSVIDADFTSSKTEPQGPEITKKEIKNKLDGLKNSGQVGNTISCPDLDGQEIGIENCELCTSKEVCVEYQP